MAETRGKPVGHNGTAHKPRSGVSDLRRTQIVEAAVSVIARRGIDKLSLSAVEKQAGMSRGQLTYYFPTKEAILLAVFDRMMEMMCQRARTTFETQFQGLDVWGRMAFFFKLILTEAMPHPEFHALQHTFLSQIGHRDDFRQRLATLYEQWRQHMAGSFRAEWDANPAAGAPAPRAMASLIQAIAHGLSVQLAADPDAFDRNEMLDLCLGLIGVYRANSRRPKPAPKPGKGRVHE